MQALKSLNETGRLEEIKFPSDDGEGRRKRAAEREEVSISFPRLIIC